MGVLGDGEMIVGDGTGDPVAESGATLRTSIGVGTGDSPQFTNLVLSGDLTVTGTRTELQVANLNVEDKNITVASGSADSSAADGAGLTVAGAGATFTYTHSGTRWNTNKPLNVTGDITLSGTVDGIDIGTDVAANTLKATNVSTNLSKTASETDVTINSSDGDNIAIGAASTSVAGVMTKALFDKLDGIEASATADQTTTDLGLQNVTNESKGTMFTSPTFTGTIAIPNIANLETAVAANTLKATNVSTNLSKTTAAAQITINSSDGDNVVIGEATGTIAGLMSTTHHNKLDGIEASATADQTLADLNLDTSDDVRFDSFGVGTAASGVTGEIRATGDITAYYSSDERLKENFSPLTGALDKVKAIGGYEFDWKDGIEDVVSKTGHDIGVKAQELQVQYPELVHTRDNGYLAVDYVKLSAVLIEAIKELSEKIDNME